MEHKETINTRQKWESKILPVALIVGVLLLIYPSAADYWNSFHQTRAVMGYAEQVASMEQARYADLLEEAREYNRKLADSGIDWMMDEEHRAEYESVLNFNSAGIMGYVDIPKINVRLPIYHGTSDAVLQTSIGHLEESSLPVGGENTHCALSGHRGLPSAKLFSDIDKLTEGETFTISVLNETLTYEVDRIRVVEPNDLSELRIYKGQDLCTLVTCTPYGINTHRLLVRGHRVKNLNGEAQVTADALQMEAYFVAPFIMLPFLLILLLILFVKPVRT